LQLFKQPSRYFWADDKSATKTVDGKKKEKNFGCRHFLARRVALPNDGKDKFMGREKGRVENSCTGFRF